MEITDPMTFCYFTALGWTVPHDDSLSTIGTRSVVVNVDWDETEGTPVWYTGL